MKIEFYERVFMVLSAILLVVGLLAVFGTVAFAGAHLPSPAGRIDPKKVRETAPFNQPGVTQTADGEYEVVIVAQTWSFVPGEINVKRGANGEAKVTFRAASPDVIHGFMIEHTRVNAMIIPGQITKVTATFDQPGEYLIICHEYCGIGHHGMYGRVVVE